MPDEWEVAHQLNPEDAADGTKIVPGGASPGDRHKGYTWLEFYLNELARERIADYAPSKIEPLLPAAVVEKPRKPIAELVAEITSQDMQRKQTDTEVSFYAIQNLVRMGEASAPAAPPLIRALDTDDPRTACFVAWGVGAVGANIQDKRPAVGALVKCLQQKWKVRNSKWNFNPRGFAAWALGRIGPEASPAVPALVKVLHGEDLWARRPAAWALSRILRQDAKTDPATIDALVRALAYDSGGAWSTMNNCHVHAVDALAAVGKAARPALIKALKSKDAAVRRGAVEVLARSGEQSAELLDAMKDPDRRVRLAAIYGVAAGDRLEAETCDALIEQAGDGDYGIRAAAFSRFEVLELTDDQARKVQNLARKEQREEVLEFAREFR
jgi:HEAT repeat protein